VTVTNWFYDDPLEEVYIRVRLRDKLSGCLHPLDVARICRRIADKEEKNFADCPRSWEGQSRVPDWGDSDGRG